MGELDGFIRRIKKIDDSSTIQTFTIFRYFPKGIIQFYSPEKFCDIVRTLREEQPLRIV